MLSIVLVVLFASLAYLYGTRSFKYWVERGVKHDKPLPVFGNALDKFLQKISLCDLYSEAYRKFPNEKFVGLYLANDPKLILRDPELIKHVLITDFQHFHARGILPLENDLEPMFRNIFFADGDLWKLLRQRLTPAFTSGKLKAMFTLIVERAEKLQTIVIDTAEDGVEVDMRDLMAREAMRMFPSIGYLMRRCTGRYTFPGTSVTIDEGIGVVVPIHAIQNDEQYFQDPSEFKPERFSPENVSSMPNHVYLPFGEGPRACIGERLGMLQSLAGVAAVLQRCSVEPGPTTVGTPVTDPTSTITQLIRGGLPLAIRVRNPQEKRKENN
ncbi:cytochrome P450 6B1-like isoform X2 [Cydia pomonella]|uniref:cytochrome P450 6B1-like isoform X2 n=1 Tax=Cydia pomonella TaxID=82600 RepID=UPI002ADD4806|nr:cytochrome P450 6B1-like isoform X2 [Cydia pomonella]